MTQLSTPAAPATATSTRSGLRTLSVIRAVFSAIWVVLVLTTTAGLHSPDRPTAIAAILLVVYPLWDVVATLLERPLAGSMSRTGLVNVVLGLLATIAMIVAVLDTVGAALLVFGVWALFSGAIQLVTALLRRRTLGAQWPMIVSGGISVFAGASFALMSSAASSQLTGVGGYSAFGAVWFVVSAVLLTVRLRRSGE
jgi:uncharacterized membrane protein HdeD (DUF308 family)